MYSIEDYDEKGILKPGVMLLLAVLYVARFMLFGPLSLLAAFRPMGAGPKLDLSFLNDVSPFEMLSSVPAVLILFIMLARSETSAHWMRWTWTHASKILAACLASQLLLQGIRFLNTNELTLDQFVMVLINLYFLYYFLFGTRPRLVFSMFPSKKSETST